MIAISFNVHIMDDEILESDEMFRLSIKSNSLPNSVSVDDPNEATVTIVDDDCKFCK